MAKDDFDMDFHFDDDDFDPKAFLDELRCRNGNLEITVPVVMRCMAGRKRIIPYIY